MVTSETLSRSERSVTEILPWSWSISRMFLLSGNTRIDFDGTYKLVDVKDENGSPRGIISFNKTGKLTDAPDEKYVRNVPDYFPGTIIFAKLLINDDDLSNE